MPRNGSGVYSPDWVNAAPSTTIESAKQNAMVADIVTDLNAARPVTAGGTGETTARLKDGTWRFQNTSDTTKLLAFDLSGLTTATTRTVTVPDANGTMLLNGDIASALDMETATSLTTLVSPGRQHFHPSAAKVWGQITVSGGVPSLAASYNVTSIADTDVGRCTVTIANDFSSATWASSVTILGGGASNTFAQFSSKGSGSFILRSISLADAFADPAGYDFVGFGDL